MPEYRFSLGARLRIWLAPIWMQAREFVLDVVEDMPLLTRVASHVGLLFVVMLTIAASGVQLNVGGRIEKNADPALNTDISLVPDPIQDRKTGSH